MAATSQQIRSLQERIYKSPELDKNAIQKRNWNKYEFDYFIENRQYIDICVRREKYEKMQIELTDAQNNLDQIRDGILKELKELNVLKYDQGVINDILDSVVKNTFEIDNFDQFSHLEDPQIDKTRSPMPTKQSSISNLSKVSESITKPEM